MPPQLHRRDARQCRCTTRASCTAAAQGWRERYLLGAYVSTRENQGRPAQHRRVRTINVAETASLAFLCMVKTSCPIDGDITFLTVKASGTLHAPTSAYPAEFEKTIKDWTIISDVVLCLLSHEIVHVVRRDPSKELNVLVGVELRHLGDNRWFGALFKWRVSNDNDNKASGGRRRQNVMRKLGTQAWAESGQGRKHSRRPLRTCRHCNS